MEKLIMLLDIYEEEVVGVHSVGDKITDKEVARIISKQFGFIEWLVQNDKIDKACLFFNTADLPDDNVSKLLMLLAISDNPIEVLISYLK